MTAARILLRWTCAFHVGRVVGHALHHHFVTHIKESRA